MIPTSYDCTDVFISYSHEDAKYLMRLKTHLAYYERNGSLSVWEDTKLAPGSEWRAEIEEAIKKTRIAILLVSADFLASKFIAENELPPLLAAAKTEGTIIIPVILSACAFQATELAQFQAQNKPSNPIDSMRKSDKEKMWAEIARRVDLELSRASEHRPDWMFTTLDVFRPPFNVLSTYDVRKIAPAFQLDLEGSVAVELFKQFKDTETADYVIINLGTGQNWLTSRLYIFAIMLERMRGLRCFVFLETRGDVDHRFLGIASPREVRWTLARQYPWLETAFAKAYSLATTGPFDYRASEFRILSSAGALDPDVAQQLVFFFLSNPLIQQILMPGSSPDPQPSGYGEPLKWDPSEWESLAPEDAALALPENGQQLWEHAKWLDATYLRQDLGDILQQDESTWIKESPDASYIEQARTILRRKDSFVALVDEEMRFKSLIDRQDLLERIVANQ